MGFIYILHLFLVIGFHLPAQTGASYVDPSPEIVKCVDQDSRCKEWADRGECYLNPMYMLTDCKLSCDTCVNCAGGCGPGTCVDWNKCDCPSPYQQVGYTCLNPEDFSECKNYNTQCEGWAARGDCETGPNMHLFCKKACGICSTTYNGEYLDSSSSEFSHESLEIN